MFLVWQGASVETRSWLKLIFPDSKYKSGNTRSVIVESVVDLLETLSGCHGRWDTFHPLWGGEYSMELWGTLGKMIGNKWQMGVAIEALWNRVIHQICPCRLVIAVLRFGKSRKGLPAQLSFPVFNKLNRTFSKYFKTWCSGGVPWKPYPPPATGSNRASFRQKGNHLLPPSLQIFSAQTRKTERIVKLGTTDPSPFLAKTWN